MTSVMGLDTYEERGRVLPAILAALPVLLAMFLCFPSLREIVPAIVLVALAVGCAPLLAWIALRRRARSDPAARNAAIVLTWADEEIPPALKKEMRAGLVHFLPEFPLLNVHEEKLDPKTARTLCAEIIAAAAPSFVGRRNYPLIDVELASLGFRRNLLALRFYSLMNARAGAVLALLCAMFSPAGTSAPVTCLLAACICTATAIIFEEAITPAWVCAAEKEYVKQLLLAVVGEDRALIRQSAGLKLGSAA